MGHPQPAAQMNTDNQTATGILNGTIKQKRSKTIDMRFYWLKDRQDQGQFDIQWVPGKHNLADYYYIPSTIQGHITENYGQYTYMSRRRAQQHYTGVLKLLIVRHQSVQP